MTDKFKVSIIIPTYRRSHLIGYTLDALTRQLYKDFEVLVIVKPSGDETEKVVKSYEKMLRIKLIFQDGGYLVNALNLGLKHAKGDIIAFLDDDAIPFPDWVQRHIGTYKDLCIGGVAGNVIPAKLITKFLIQTRDKATEIIPSYKPFLSEIGQKIWSRPLKDLEDYLIYISKAGLVEYNSELAYLALRRPVKSLLGMGTNISVLSEAIGEFKFPDSWILGLAWEQFLGWHVWKAGYTLMFNPEAKVYHLTHGETLTRGIKSAKKDFLRCIENCLLFYRLYGLEPELSWKHRITWLIFSSLYDLKKICVDREKQQFVSLKSKFYTEIIGLKWLVSRKMGCAYTVLQDLEKLVESSVYA